MGACRGIVRSIIWHQGDAIVRNEDHWMLKFENTEHLKFVWGKQISEAVWFVGAVEKWEGFP